MNADTATASPSRGTAVFAWAGFTLGSALGGFFDGILLHQVLQWHHLLSGLEQGAFGDLRTQILADGLFHALMYVIGLLGLYLLVRSRRAFQIDGAQRKLLIFALYGFATWHALDAVFSHWVLGIHRIRMASSNPLVWDLAWLLVFGLIPFLIALRMHKSQGPSSGAGGRHSIRAVVILAFSVGVAGLISLLPLRTPPTDSLVVILRPDVKPAELFRGMDRAGASLLWSDARGGVWVLKTQAHTRPAFFYQYGALYVSGTGMAAGCIDWFRL